MTCKECERLVFRIDGVLKFKYLVCTLVRILQLVKSFSMKVDHILSFILLTLNIVWGKSRRGGALAS
jgi:hypothetical protein